MGDEYWRNAFRPLLPGIAHLTFNSFESLEQITDQTACVVAETIQAEAGVIVPEKNWMQALRKKCDETGSMLVLDEIQCGFGRNGTLWAFQQFDIVPDILLLGKALGGGMPLGAFIANKKIMDSLASKPVLGHINTFGGHPVCCAAGNAALQVLLGENIIASVFEKENLFIKYLESPKIKSIRSKGLMIGMGAIVMDNTKIGCNCIIAAGAVVLENTEIEPGSIYAGVIVPEKNWMQALRKKCDETGSMLVLDEIQCGFGRNGTLWAFQQFDIVPDILLLGKALGGGMPLGAFIANKKIMDSLASKPVLGHINTFGGHPVCCAAGNAALQVLLGENIIASVFEKENLFIKYLESPKIKSIRSKGLMIGMGAIVMDNTKIGCNCIIAAGAVVLENTEIEPGSIYAGVPAKKIKNIPQELIDGEITRIADNYIMYADWFKAKVEI